MLATAVDGGAVEGYGLPPRGAARLQGPFRALIDLLEEEEELRQDD